jgi:hypothetical protein
VTKFGRGEEAVLRRLELASTTRGYEAMKVQIRRMKIQPSRTTGEQKERNPARDCISTSEIEPEVSAFAAAGLARSSLYWESCLHFIGVN